MGSPAASLTFRSAPDRYAQSGSCPSYAPAPAPIPALAFSAPAEGNRTIAFPAANIGLLRLRPPIAGSVPTAALQSKQALECESALNTVRDRGLRPSPVPTSRYQSLHGTNQSVPAAPRYQPVGSSRSTVPTSWYQPQATSPIPKVLPQAVKVLASWEIPGSCAPEGILTGWACMRGPIVRVTASPSQWEVGTHGSSTRCKAAQVAWRTSWASRTSCIAAYSLPPVGGAFL